ncbi:MAG: carboxylating nicotinate-nucleotide diphosphorylase [Planctomycetia bacterium]|nr:carboxylating nicotinate-nucleotide diphosphorylase [Planctomycetia bacterium]
MPSFHHDETFACQRLIQLALDEDLDGQSDLTSEATIPADLTGQAVYVARSPGVLAGLPAAALVLETVDARLRFQPLVEDGSAVERGTRLATVVGPMRSLLTAERTSLNFLQRLSGVATQTRRYVEVVAGLPCRILDTRKTTPGWRLLEKYAVRCGGGYNHRMGLYDGMLIKDNHLAALPVADRAGKIAEALRRARAAVGTSKPVEIEVDDLEQFDVALAHGPDIILLDNMSPDLMREAVARRNARAPRVQLEASGGITLQTLRAIAETGVDRISVGALTHSAVALDIALDYAER